MTEESELFPHEVLSQTLTRWVNSKIKVRKLNIISIDTELEDGTILIHLIEILAKGPIGVQWNKAPQDEYSKIENIRLAIEFSQKLEIQLNPRITPQAIHQEDPQAILDFLWALISRFVFDTIGNEGEPRDNLLEWLQRVTANYHQLNIVDLYQSWLDGLGFLALYDYAFPDDIEFETFLSGYAKENFEVAYEMWESKGHYFLLNPADDEFGYDPHSIYLELAELYRFIKEKKNKEEFEAQRFITITDERTRGIERSRFHFHISYFTHWGQALYIYGGAKELGDWNHEKAVKLEYENSETWGIVLDITYEGNGSEIYYRYFVKGDKNVIDEEGDDSHLLRFLDVPSDTEIVLDDQYHTEFIGRDYDKSVDWNGIRECHKIDSPLIFTDRLFSNSIRIFITCYAPSIKWDQNLKLVVEKTGDEYFLDPSGFPWFSCYFDIPSPVYPVSYKYVAVLPDQKESTENTTRRPRVELEEENFIRIDNWIVKPFN